MNLGRFLVGLLATALGVLFLLDALEVLDAGRTVAAAWPLAVVAAGVVQLVEQRRLAPGPVIVVVVGIVLLGSTTGIARPDWSLLWPIALVAVGLWLLLRRNGAPATDRGSGEDRIEATALLSGRELRSTSRAFTGGTLTAVLGGLEVDLRDAVIAEDGATLDITAILGGIEIRVPSTWHVDVRAAAILGGFDDGRKRTPVPEDAPTLTITGLLLLGGGDLNS